MQLYIWAKKFNIPLDALKELESIFGISNTIGSGKNERHIQDVVKLEASKKGCRLWRNNLGATYTQQGTFIRYGLANESEKMSAVIKSSDLIGIRPIKINKKHLGLVIGQFLSREIKSANWKFSNTKREVAQLNWIQLINSLGGDACFTNMEGSI